MGEKTLTALSCVIPQLNQFHVSETTGFLLEMPLRELPEYFSPWMDIGMHASELVVAHKLREKIDKMPLLDASQLHGHKQLRLANLFLSLMTSGYVWQEGDKGIITKVPKQLAVPMCYVAKKLDIPEILTHCAVCAANWQLIDPNGPTELSNMKTISTVPGGLSSSWFFLVTAQVELCAIPGLKAISKAQEGVLKGCLDAVHSALEVINSSLIEMKEAMSRMFEKLPPETFYNVVRPYLAGWGGPNSPAPDGIVFEGVSDEPKKAVGGNAAQSPPLQCFDAVLNIQHLPERQRFLDLMQKYMLPDHRAYIKAVRSGPSVRKFVMEQDSDSLTVAYNKTVSSLESLRTYHIQLATRYIVIPGSKKRTAEFESVSKKGTGGTEIIPFLKCIRDSTKAFYVATEINNQ